MAKMLAVQAVSFTDLISRDKRQVLGTRSEEDPAPITGDSGADPPPPGTADVTEASKASPMRSEGTSALCTLEYTRASVRGAAAACASGERSRLYSMESSPRAAPTL